MHFVPTSLATSIVYHVFCLHQHCDTPQTTAVQLHLATVRWFTKAKYSASSLSTVQLHLFCINILSHRRQILDCIVLNSDASQSSPDASSLPSQIPRFSASTLRWPTKPKPSVSLLSIVQWLHPVFMHQHCDGQLKSNTVHPDFMHQHYDGQLRPNPVHRGSQLCSGTIAASSFYASTLWWSTTVKYSASIQSRCIQLFCINIPTPCPGRDHTLGWKLMQSDQHPRPSSNQVGVQKSNEIVDLFVDGFPTDTGALPRLWWVP